jgi:membrane protease YdiL (CAAX protease family)
MNAATSWRAMHGVLLLVLLMAVSFVPVLRLWPWPWITPLVGYFLVVVAVPSLRASFQPPRFGRITQLGIVTATVIAAVSCVVLIGFQIVSHPDMRAYTHAIPVGSLGGMAAGGVCFAVMNAFLEEFVFRHVLFDAISSQWGSWGAIGASASLFGFAHLHGYPPGTAGTILAGIFGFALGWLRMLTRGIGLPVIAHVAADATIFWILARSTAL